MGFKLRPGTSVFGNVTFTPGTNENYVGPPVPSMYMVVGGWAGSKVFIYDVNDLTKSPIEVEQSTDSTMFGHKIAVYGNMIYAADPYNYPSYIYVYNIDDLSSGPTILNSPTGNNDSTYFGMDMSVDEDHLVVSEYGTDTFYVYDRNNLLSEPVSKTTTDSSGAISSSGDIIVIGSSSESPRGLYSGRAYILNKNNMSSNGGGGIDSITPNDGSRFDFFGVDVATDGNIIAISAFRDNESGSVYIYDATDYSYHQYKLTGPSGYTNDSSNFGYSLDFSDNHLVVGSPGKTGNRGTAWVYDKNDFSVAPIQLMPSELDEQDRFGEKVSVNNDVIVVGARRDDDAGNNLGAVYVYDATNLSSEPIKIINGNATTEFGWSVAVDPVPAPAPT